MGEYSFVACLSHLTIDHAGGGGVVRSFGMLEVLPSRLVFGSRVFRCLVPVGVIYNLSYCEDD